MANIKNAVKLGVFTLAIMNVTAVVSLRGLPAEAVYGMSSAFYYLFAAIVFLIPTSLVAAELAAMFQDKQGGDRKSTRLNSSHITRSRMPSSA